MKKELSRIEERERTARFLNTLDAEVLWERFAISRVSRIDGFDELDVPVWSSTRPLSSSISINSGKGLTNMMARAGAIAEGIEFHYAESPRPVQTERIISHMDRWRDFEVVPPYKWHLAKGAYVTELSLFDWDVVAPIQRLEQLNCLYPSEGVYINCMNVTHLMRVQSSTNGWATGSSLEDAVLQGLYEVVERDGWTIWNVLVEHRGVWPKRIDISDCREWDWFPLVERLDDAAIKLVVFDISTDASLPVAWALLYDLSDRPAGLFNGFGCAGTQTGAIQRALLEAIQSRVCYIAGARDDMLRRSFMLLKNLDQFAAYTSVMQIPATVPFEYTPPGTLNAKDELAATLETLAEHGFTEFYVKDAGKPFPRLSVAKVIAPCLEQHKGEYWTPSKRTIEYLESYAPR